MPGQPNRRDRKRREANQRKYAELKALRDKWVKQGIVQHGVMPEDALQRVIDDATMRYLEEYEGNERLRAEGKAVSGVREQKLRKDMAYYASLAIQYRLDERRVRTSEARVALFMSAFEATVRHPDIDLPPDKVRLLPGLMKEHLLSMRAGRDE